MIDHKTALGREDDPFLPQYIAQVNAYANIAEVGLDLGEVSLGALLYWESQIDSVKEDPNKYYVRNRLLIPFSPKPIQVKIDYKLLDHLTKEFIEVTNAAAPPEGRKKCDDCKKLDLILAIDQELRVRDKMILHQNQDRPLLRKSINNRLFLHENYLRDLLIELDEKGEGLFSDNGLVSSWSLDSDEIAAR